MGSGFTAPIDVEFRATGIEGVRNGMRLVKTEAEGMSHGAIFGLAELSRGLGRIAQSGSASALGMRELSGGIMRLGQSLGPGAGLIGIFTILGGVIYETFAKAREEMLKTQVEFNNGLIEMTRSLAVARLAGTSGIATQLYSGDATARALLSKPDKTNGDVDALKKLGINTGDEDLAFLARTQGIVGLRNEIPKLQAAMDAVGGPFRAGSREGDKLREAQAILKQMEEQAKRTTAAADIAIKESVDQVTMGIKLASENKDIKELFGHGGHADFSDLISGEQFKETVLKRMLPGQIGDMSRSLIDQLKQDLDVEMLKGSNAKTTNDRMEALKKYAEILKQIDELSGKPGELGVLGGKGPRVAKLTESVGEILADARVKIIKQIDTDFTHDIEDALVNGLQEAFSGQGLTGLGKGFIKGMLGVLGDIAIQLGEAVIPIGAWMESFTAALFSLNGPAAIAAGIGLIVAGGALKAGASAIGRSGGSHGGSSSYSAPTQIIDRGSINPVMSASNLMPRSPVSVTVIGERDPVAQSSLLRMISNAQKRGGIS